MSERTGLRTAIQGASEPNLVMKRISEEVLRLVPSADGCFVALVDGDVLIWQSGAGAFAAAVGMQLGIDESLSGLALKTGATFRCDDTEVNPLVDRAVARRFGAVSFVAVPLWDGDRPFGALVATSAVRAAFSHQDVLTLSDVADFVTATISTTSRLQRATRALFARIAAEKELPESSDEGISTFVADVLRPGAAQDVDAAERVTDALATRAFTTVFQPIVDLCTDEVVGAEALTRFALRPHRPPDVWFADAHRIGLGVELELAAMHAALGHLRELPLPVFLALNVASETVMSPDLSRELEGFDPRRLVLELTEHVEFGDYPELRRALTAIRSQGVRLAVDDVGAGSAGLSHVVKLAPDIIKIDRELISGIDFDPVRRDLMSAVVSVAPGLGATIVAEGVETKDERDTLVTIGVELGQGYYLGRPGRLESLGGRRFRTLRE